MKKLIKKLCQAMKKAIEDKYYIYAIVIFILIIFGLAVYITNK